MLDFSRWFAGQAPAPAEPTLADKLEDIGLDLMKDGSVWGPCRSCERSIRWTDYMTAEECLTNEMWYCGGSDRCTP